MGGRDIDLNHASWIAGKEFKKTSGVDVRGDVLTLQSRQAAEKARLNFQLLIETEINIPLSLQQQVHRLSKILAEKEYINRSIEITKRAMNLVSNIPGINEIIMVGRGQTYAENCRRSKKGVW